MPTRRRACDACYKRKIQCDATGTGSQCNWCIHHDLVCTFERVSGRKGKRRLMPQTGSMQHDQQMSEQHQRAVENLPVAEQHHHVAQQRSLPSPEASISTPLPLLSSPRPTSRHTNKAALGQIYFAGQNLASFGCQNGIPHFTRQGEDWVVSRTGQRPCISSTNSQTSTAAAIFSARRAWHGQQTSLPEIWVVQSLLKAYLRSDFSQVFPLVDPVLFEDTIRLAYASTYPRSLDEYATQACVFAFICLGSSSYLELEAVSKVDIDACAAQAQFLLFQVLQDASVVTLQAEFMMLMHETSCGRLDTASMYHSLACRAMFVLGGHTLVLKDTDGDVLSTQDRQDRLLRMMFWLCYIFDKDNALRSGQAPIINDEFCDLSLPEGSHQGRIQAITSCQGAWHPGDNLKAPWFPHDLRASLLKSKACRLLYSAAALRMSDTELLRTIRELDEELESWRLSLPAHIAPSLDASKHRWLVPDVDKHRSMLHIELHLNYYHLMNAIHTASGRCLVDGNGLGITGIQSSLELSAAASRATLTYLSAAAHRLLGEAFWVFIFYPMSALMTVFFSILWNPLDDQACRDVELLESASHVIRSMPIKHITAMEMAYMREVDDIIAELSRLGRCAISKSRAEQRV